MKLSWKKTGIIAGIIGLLTVSYPGPTQAHWLFDDIDTVPWAETSIINGYQMEVIDGMEENLFYPNEPVTAAQFIKMSVQSIQPEYRLETIGNPGPWWEPYVEEAVENLGIYSGNTDSINEPITRLDIAHISAKVVNEQMRFQQLPDVDAVNEVTSKGILQGRSQNDLALNESLTRAEAAVLIDRLMSYLDLYGRPLGPLAVTVVDGDRISLNGITIGMTRGEIYSELGEPLMSVEEMYESDVYKEVLVNYLDDKVVSLVYKAFDKELDSGEADISPEAAIYRGFNTTYYYLEQSEQILMSKDKRIYIVPADPNFYINVEEGGIAPVNQKARELDLSDHLSQ